MQKSIWIVSIILLLPLTVSAALIKAPSIDKYSLIESISTFEQTPSDVKEDMKDILASSTDQDTNSTQIKDLECDYVGKSKLVLCKTDIIAEEVKLEATSESKHLYHIESVHFMNSYEPLRVTIVK